MDDQLGLFARGPRKPGPLENATAKTLSAWRKREWLTGPEHTAARAQLRGFARAVDAAEDRMLHGDGSPYSVAACLSQYRACLEAHSPPPLEAPDHAGAELEAAALRVIAAAADGLEPPAITA